MTPRLLRRPSAGLLAAVLVLALAGCGGSGRGDAAAGTSAAIPPAGPASGSQGPTAQEPGTHPLDFRATTLMGEQLDASALAGQDVVLWFWAPWCTVCRAEAPQVAAAAEEMAGRVEVLGVASSGTVEDMRAFVTETGSTSFPHVADVPGEVWQRFGVVAQPTFVFVDDDGRTQTVVGGLAQAALLDAMRQLEEA